jgi:hypothetical protein
MVTSNPLPGCAAARLAGTVKRRLASIVKIMVEPSHRPNNVNQLGFVLMTGQVSHCSFAGKPGR